LVDVFAQRKVLGGELNLISVHDGDDSTRRSAHNGILTQCSCLYGPTGLSPAC
jgi:hypothetical protein